MSYTSSPYAAKARYLAAKLVVKEGLKKAAVAKMYGVNKSTISRWVERFPKGHKNWHNDYYISTLSSAPNHHPNQTSEKLVEEIIRLRKRLQDVPLSSMPILKGLTGHYRKNALMESTLMRKLLLKV